MIKILDNVSDNFKRVFGRYLWSWIAPCNCYINNSIQHNDGGNYHSVLKFFEFVIGNKDIFVLIKSDTRDFLGEKRYVVYENYVLLEIFDWEEILFYEIIEI